MRTLFVSVLALLLLIACDDGSFTRDSGSGTNTLYVVAHIEGEPDQYTQIMVEVDLDGDELSGAVVTINSDLGQVTLRETDDGEYEAEQSGFASGYHLRIESGEHSLKGSLNAPKAHTIDNPEHGSTYDTQNGDLEVIWSPAGADRVQVANDEFELDFTDDSGKAIIPARTFEDDEDEIEVKRTNRMNLAGGVGDSYFEIEYEVSAEIFVVNPYD